MNINMTIETKFNIKDHAYVLIENKVKYVDIYKIIIDVDYRYNINIRYVIGYFSGNEFTKGEVSENRLFPTKEELIKSL